MSRDGPRPPPAVPDGPLALDCSLAGGAPTGIGRYTVRLAAALAAGPLRDRLWLLGGRAAVLPRRVAHAPARVASRTLWMLGEVPPLLVSRRARLFHGLANFTLPLTRPPRTRFVLTVHDLIPLTHPATVSRPFRMQFSAWLARSLGLCDAVVCDSEATRRELLARFPGAPATVVPLGADHVPGRAAALAAEPLAPDRRHVLYVGALDARKQVDVLLAAFERLPRARELALVLAGAPAFGAAALLARVEALRAAGLDVRLPGPLPAGRLWGAMARADVLCCPSGAEGFGLPPLEGLALGAPVVASRIAAHEEVLGDAARYVNPGDPDDLGEALSRVLEDETCAEELRRRGPPRAARFTWRRCAEETAAVWERVLGGREVNAP